MKKRVLQVVLAGMMVVALAGCQSAGAMKSTEKSMNDTTKSMKSTEMMNTTETMKSTEMMNTTEVMKSTEMMNTTEAMKSTEMMDTGDMKYTGMDYTLKDFDGNKITGKSLAGKKVYFKYWASWCPICLSGLKDLDTLSAGNNDFQVYSVVTPDKNGEKSEKDFKKWFNSLGYKNIKVLFDEDAVLAQQLGIAAFPTSVFADTTGNLKADPPGHKTNDEITMKMSEVQ